MTTCNSHRLGARLAAGALVALAAFEPAFAQSGAGGNIGSFIQNIIDILTSGVARGLAVLAVMIIGIAWQFGLIDMRRALTAIVGIVITFAPRLSST